VGKDQPAVRFNVWNARQAEGLLLEGGWVGAGLLILDGQQLAVDAECPAVIGAGPEFRVSGPETAERSAPMRADIHKGGEPAFEVAADDHRLATDRGRQKIALVAKLAFVTQINPGSLPDRFHLELEDVRVGID